MKLYYVYLLVFSLLQLQPSNVGMQCVCMCVYMCMCACECVYERERALSLTVYIAILFYSVNMQAIKQD